MSQDQEAKNNAPKDPQHHESQAQENASSWYAKPWFWSALIVLLLLALLAWIFWKQWQANLALEAAMQERLQVQLNENANIEAKLKILRDMLNQDPCIIKEFLGTEGAILLQTPPSISPNIAPAPTQKTKNVDTTPKKTEAEAPPPKASDPNTKEPSSTVPNNSTNNALPIAQNIEQATVLIINDSSNGMKTGTGFFIAPGIILTNAHVAQGKQDKIYVIGKFTELVSSAKILAVSNTKGRDYAVLQVPIKSIAPLHFDLDVARTQKISAWGFPGAVTDIDPNFRALLKGEAVSAPEVVYSEGSVSVVQDQTPPIIFHTAVVSHGNSGGPLVNENGNVVGINTYISLDKKSYRQSSIAIVSKDIVNFLQSHNIPFTLASKE